MKVSKEVKVELCTEHRNISLSEHYPGYVFNTVLSFPARSCRYAACQNEAYWLCIGIMIPDAVGNIQRDTAMDRGTLEIFREAKNLLDGGPAIDKLSYYLQTRLVPSVYREFMAEKLIRIFAGLTLDKLKIDHRQTLSDVDKDRILRELRLYPEEYSSGS